MGLVHLQYRGTKAKCTFRKKLQYLQSCITRPLLKVESEKGKTGMELEEKNSKILTP